MKLPDWEADLAIKLVEEPPEELDVFIPLMPEEQSAGLRAAEITWPARSSTVGRGTQVIGSVNVGRLTEWLLEIGPGANPGEDDWVVLASGDENVQNEVLGTIDPEDFEPRVYTLRLTARQGLLAPLAATILVNVTTEPPTPPVRTGTSGPESPTIPFDEGPPEPVEPEEPEEP